MNLTIRAVLVGMVIGVVMCISNLYVFFKTGWSMGVTITAAILAWGSFKLLAATGIARRPLGPLENSALTTVASGAGYMTGGGNMAAYGALMMILAAHPGVLAVPSTPALIVWFAAIAMLGVFIAIPIKRQLINKEGVPFPTGTATALTIKSLHASREGGARQARALAYASLFGAALAWLRDAWKLLPEAIPNPISHAGYTLADWTLTLKTEVVLIGAGALMSFRTGWSLLLGGVLTYGVLAPVLFHQGEIAAVSYKEIIKWSMWPGAGLLVGSGLTQFALDYKSLGRAFSGLGRILRKDRSAGAGAGVGADQGIAAVESPDWWFPAAFAVLAPIIVVLMVVLWQIPVWAGAIAVVLAVLMGFIAARVTGETDVTPTKALGPVTQMTFGAMAPGALPANIMGANVTGGAGLHAADLLTTLKTGWLLGGKPRHQLYAQLFGVLVGASIVVPAFGLLFPDADKNPDLLGGKQWPAPSCVVWKGVSEVVVDGVGMLPQSAQLALVIGVLLGIGLALLERVAPKHMKTFLPSANGLGIAMVVPGSNCLGMFLGALAAEYMRRVHPKLGDTYTVPVASGFIAGESLMGVAIIALTKIAGITLELDL